MIRSGFKRPERTKPAPAPLRRLERACTYSGGTIGEPIAKEDASQSAAYMDAVRSLPCQRCNHPPRSQFCHADQGKGTGIKTDVRRGWAGCGPHGNEMGCHHLIGTSGTLPKAERRAEEKRLAAKTRAEILRRNLWPKSLAPWKEEA
jgi:hypothetical protein